MTLRMIIGRPTIFRGRRLYAWLHDDRSKPKHPSVHLLGEHHNIPHYHRLGQTSRPFKPKGATLPMDVWVRTELYACAISMVGVTLSSHVEALLVG